MPVMPGLRALAAAVVLLSAGACSSPTPDASPTAPPAVSTSAGGGLTPSEPFGVTTVTLRSPGGDAVTLDVYDAYRPEARRRGLMGRRHLPERAGMVFRFPRDHRGAFWMRDTVIPLSIAFFDGDGAVLATLDMAPCPGDPCPRYDPEVTYRGALEVNQGLFDRIGLDEGWRVELPPDLPPPE